MQQNQRSEEFKRSAVQKVLLRGGKTVEAICEELSISTPTFYEWKKKYANAPGMKTKDKRPQDFNAVEKFKAVVDFEGLSEEKQGEFLRRTGLHTDHLIAWKKLMEASLEPVKKLTAEERLERNQHLQKIKDLEREINRKDKSLAEVAALLILKKKADLLWGTGESE